MRKEDTVSAAIEPQSTKKPIGQIATAGGLAALVAIVVNAVLYFVGSALGGFPDTTITPMGVPINIKPIQ
jgi:hypothetical protein